MSKSLELVFEDISNFDVQNSVVGSLLRELDVGKKDVVSNLIKKVPRPGIDGYLKKRLNALRNDETNFNNNNTNALLPPPSPHHSTVLYHHCNLPLHLHRHLIHFLPHLHCPLIDFFLHRHHHLIHFSCNFYHHLHEYNKISTNHPQTLVK